MVIMQICVVFAYKNVHLYTSVSVYMQTYTCLQCIQYHFLYIFIIIAYMIYKHVSVHLQYMELCFIIS